MKFITVAGDPIGASLDPQNHKRFADGECSVTIKESVLGKDVFVISPTHSNDSLVEMLLVIGAARR